MTDARRVDDDEEHTRPAPRKHLSECYLINYPDDPDTHCTCWDYSE